MKVSTAIALLVTSVALTACSTASTQNIPDNTEVMKPAATAMKPAMKDSTMMKGDSCHDHSANSMTKSAKHCHKSSNANHSHKYGG